MKEGKHLQRIKREHHFFKYKYHKFTILILLIVLAYFLFKIPFFDNVFVNLRSYSYWSVFVAGLIFAFGFTAPFSIVLILLSNPSNIFLAAFIGAIGAMISDLIIFKFVKFSLMDEFEHLEKEPKIIELRHYIKHKFHFKVGNYLLYLIVGLVIASPLPDEVGVTMLAGITHINLKVLAAISLLLHFFAILLLLWI